MSIPSPEGLRTALRDLLATYDPGRLAAPDPAGEWRYEVTTLADRIGNEIVHTLWLAAAGRPYESGAPPDPDPSPTDPETVIDGLLAPLIADTGVRAGALCLYGRTSEPEDDAGWLRVVLAVLGEFVAYEVNRVNGRAYVPAWDRRGKEIRARYREQSRDFARRLTGLFTARAELAPLVRTRRRLRLEAPLFGRIARLVAVEENVRTLLWEYSVRNDSAGRQRISYTLMNESVRSTFAAAAADELGALLRPCLEILSDPDLEIATGLPYEAVSIVSALRDPRSLATLVALLERIDPACADLRANLAYAIGRLDSDAAREPLTDLLLQPDAVTVGPGTGATPSLRSLKPTKREAIWALGRLGGRAVESIPVLARCADSTWDDSRLGLAWAMGRIGEDQKRTTGGVDAEIIIALMRLLVDDDPRIFEEAAASLDRLGLPDFLSSLYLHAVETVPILSLKPSRTGLYEISETLRYLLSLREPVVMAVTGDSGTGKTYFCDCLLDGFGDLEARDILYLQRDRPAHMQILNRILGIRILRENVDPAHYAEYPVDEAGDDPSGYFRSFLEQNRGRRLIILDGWRDQAYFHHVLRRFYEEGWLDLVINFRTTHSTRRLNLEGREHLLDRVLDCLACTEQPVAATRFWREGKVLVYNLDNSIGARLTGPETREVFARRRIEAWGDYVRIGDLGEGSQPLPVADGTLPTGRVSSPVATGDITPGPGRPFTSAESIFERRLNPDPEGDPFLLQSVRLPGAGPERIAFYEPGRIAFCDASGRAGILTGLNDRILSTAVSDTPLTALTVAGDDLVVVDADGRLLRVDFGGGAVTVLEELPRPAVLASDGAGLVVTGHADGTARLFEPATGRRTLIPAHDGAVTALAFDRRGGLLTAGSDQRIVLWRRDPGGETWSGLSVSGISCPVTAADLYPDGRILLACGGSAPALLLVDPVTGRFTELRPPLAGSLAVVNAYFDGRIFAGVERDGTGGGSGAGTLAVVDPGRGFRGYTSCPGHALATRDCLTMGPRFITCGDDGGGERSIRIHGSPAYVHSESGKLALLPDPARKPPFYRTLF